MIENAVVIGAGPAGLAAASQLELYGITPLVYEADTPGGLLLEASSVRNYSGVPPGIPGSDLAALFPLPRRLVKARVTELSRADSIYVVETSVGTEQARAVIVATGTVPVKPEFPGIQAESISYGIRRLNTSSLNSVAVIGGGDAALDYAVTLSRSVHMVRVYARGRFRAVEHLMKRVSETPGIELFENHVDFTGFDEDAVVAACGRTPALDFLDAGLLSGAPDNGSFHLAGDCRNRLFRQVSIAAGDGVRAAMTVAGFLKGECEG